MNAKTTRLGGGGVVAGVAVAAVLWMATAHEAEAQDAAPQRRGPVARANPEMIMSLRHRLELTDEQLAALEELRAEGVAYRTEARSRVDEMRSRLRAGEIDRDEMRAFMEEMRSARPRAEDRRARIEGILTEDQLGDLREIRSRRPALRGNRAQMRPGRTGMRGVRASIRGGPGAWPRHRMRMRIRHDVIRAEIRRGRR